ncbi:MAG: hypothetical protein H6978_07945 [Gammaproteobacteria bacterium]|nr:hypothetical protein [Gammaproteobacteria bacterium]
MTMTKHLPLALAGVLCTSGAMAQAPSCDENCLIGHARHYLTDVVKQDFSKLPWADNVRYTENNVAMMIGDGFWGAGPGVAGDGMFFTDPSTGNVVWYGITTEHGQAAYHGLRLKVSGNQISEVESYLGREGEPELFAKVETYAAYSGFTSEVPEDKRQSREQLIALVDGYFNSKQQNNGQVFTNFARGCEAATNGLPTTRGDYWAAKVARGCEAQLKAGVYKPVDRIRARRYPVVDVARGVVIAQSIEDHAVRYVDYQTTRGAPLKVEIEYPNSRGRLDVFKIEDGGISRIEGVSVFLPYYIHSLWTQ